MINLLNDISTDPRSPAHLRKYLSENGDSAGTPKGSALYNVLSFLYDLRTALPRANESLGGSGAPFRQLANVIIDQIQSIPNEVSLEANMMALSHTLEPYFGEDGSQAGRDITEKEVSALLNLLSREPNQSSRRELGP